MIDRGHVALLLLLSLTMMTSKQFYKTKTSESFSALTLCHVAYKLPLSLSLLFLLFFSLFSVFSHLRPLFLVLDYPGDRRHSTLSVFSYTEHLVRHIKDQSRRVKGEARKALFDVRKYISYCIRLHLVISSRKIIRYLHKRAN